MIYTIVTETHIDNPPYRYRNELGEEIAFSLDPSTAFSFIFHTGEHKDNVALVTKWFESAFGNNLKYAPTTLTV